MVPCEFSYAYMGKEHLTSPSQAGFGVCSVDASGPALPTKGIQFVPLVAEAVGPVPPPYNASDFLSVLGLKLGRSLLTTFPSDGFFPGRFFSLLFRWHTIP